MNTANNSAVSSKKKKTGRFNLMDLILVLIVVLVIATVLYIFDPFAWIKGMTSKQEKNIIYTVEFVNVDEAFINKIQENDLVVDAVTKNTLGTVTVPDYNHQYTELQYVEQQGVLVSYPNRYNVLVSISTAADYVEGEGYSVNSRRIAVGEKLSLRFPDFAAEGYCIGLVVS